MVNENKGGTMNTARGVEGSVAQDRERFRYFTADGSRVASPYIIDNRKFTELFGDQRAKRCGSFDKWVGRDAGGVLRRVVGRLPVDSGSAGVSEQRTERPLLPCPFCKSTNLKTYVSEEKEYVQCADCYTCGPDHIKGLHWNTRHIVAPAPDTSHIVRVTTTSGFLLGKVVHKQWRGETGWRFYPNVNNRRPSTHVYAAMEDAIPRWARPYKLEPQA